MAGEPQDSSEAGAGQEPPSRSHPVGLAGAALIVWTMRRLERRQRHEDPDAPGMVSSDEASDAVTRRAVRLAHDGREDREAVAELRDLARGRKRTLKRAEQASRLGGEHLEDAQANRAHRLIAAALNGTDVTPPTPQDLARFDALHDFYGADRPAPAVWEALLVREPRLSGLLTQAREGRFGPGDQFSSGDSPERFRDPELQRRQGESARGALALVDEVKILVGPSRASADPILTARRTRDFVNTYLRSERPA